MTITTNFSFK